MKYLIAAALFVLSFAYVPQAQAGPAASGYDHVMQTRVLRCAYDSLPPFLTIDPASKKIGGMMYDVTNEIGSRLGVKVEWSENAGYGEIAAGMQAGRYDAFCGLLWQTPSRAGAMNFSAPIYKNKVFPCVRGDAIAYDESTDALNAPDKTFAGYDGDVSHQMPSVLFPKAKITSIPATMSFAEALQGIVSRKYDAIATCSPVVVDKFNASNPGALKIAAPDHPITVVPIVLGLPAGDAKLKTMTDAAIFSMVADGTMEKLIRKYLDSYIGNTVILEKAY